MNMAILLRFRKFIIAIRLSLQEFVAIALLPAVAVQGGDTCNSMQPPQICICGSPVSCPPWSKASHRRLKSFF